MGSFRVFQFPTVKFELPHLLFLEDMTLCMMTPILTLVQFQTKKKLLGALLSVHEDHFMSSDPFVQKTDSMRTKTYFFLIFSFSFQSLSFLTSSSLMPITVSDT